MGDKVVFVIFFLLGLVLVALTIYAEQQLIAAGVCP